MKRYVSIFLAVVLLALTLSGCEEQPTSTSASTTQYVPTYIETNRSYYSDGTLASLWEYTYDLSDVMVRQRWEEYFSDGSLYRQGYYQLAPDGSILESAEDIFFQGGAPESTSFSQYDSSRDVMIWRSTTYSPNGTPLQIIDGCFDPESSALLDGKMEEYYENGILSYSQEVSREASREVHYTQSGEISYLDEVFYTHSSDGKLIAIHQSGYNTETDTSWTHDTAYTYDEAGNLTYEHSTQTQNGEPLEERRKRYAYDSAGKLAEFSDTCYLRGALLYAAQTSYVYNTSGLLVEERTNTYTNGETLFHTLTYEYNEDGELVNTTVSP